MNKKGFTLVELITTFALTAIIILLLIGVVNIIKNIYSKANIKTELYINQGNLSNALNSKINDDNLVTYEECTDTDFCYTFTFEDGETSKLVVDEKRIKFDEFVYNLPEKVKVENPMLMEKYVNVSISPEINNFLVLKIPIISELYPDIDFGINLVYSGNVSGKLLYPSCNLVSGDLNTYGSEIKCGSEYFYVMPNHTLSSKGTVSLLAKYNLNVGDNKYPNTSTYGLQDSNSTGYILNTTTYYGHLSFLPSGESKYFYGANDNEFVYDDRSNLYQYVESYESYLENLGLTGVVATLPDYYQLTTLGCKGDGYYTCEGAPSWVYSTSYWLGSVNENADDTGEMEYNMWYISIHKDFPNGFFDDEGGNSHLDSGIRPIIIVSIDEIQQ